MIKAAIFDFDDTLCLTEKTCFHIENHVIQRLGFHTMTREVHKQTWGLPIEEAIKERVPGIDPSEFMEAFEEVLPEFIEDGRFDNLSDHALEVLDKLLNSGKNTGILTSRTYPEMLHLLAPESPLHTRIQVFHYKESSKHTKPDPRVFDRMLEIFNIQPHEAVYIGDSPSDAKAANAAGIWFVASLESGLRKKKDFDGLKVDFFINEIGEVVKVIGILSELPRHSQKISQI